MAPQKGLMTMIGARWAAARARAEMNQIDLAVEVCVGQSMISQIEHGKRMPSIEVVSRASRALRTSADYLLDLTEDPAPIDALASRTLDVGYIRIFSERVAAGEPGSAKEIVSAQSPLAFRRFRLDQLGINPERTRVFRVAGDSMHSTLTAGDNIMVDYNRKRLLDQHIYVVRTNGNLVVKRARQHGDIWCWYSDNELWEPFRHRHWFTIWGEVCWSDRTFIYPN